MNINVHQGDCRAVLASFSENSIDAGVTDPPYHLTSIVKRFGAGNAAPAKSGKTGAYARAAKGFMGQTWDGGDVAFDPETWRAIYRVLKPGAHLIAFSGTRTYHRMVCAIEDAGFEIRDQLAWLYGSGFPKSHDVSKGIAKRRVEDVAPQKAVGAWLRRQREDRGLRQKDAAALWPSATGGLTGCVANWELGLGFPDAAQWAKLKEFIGFGDEMDAEVARLNARKGTRGARWSDADIIGEVEVASPGFGDLRFDGDRTIRSLDDEAAAWDGWGSALKPALEPIVLARKPLSEKSIAANVLRWGVGALNIDGCRVGTDDSTARTCNGIGQSSSFDMAASGEVRINGGSPLGRWPANVIHDASEEAVAQFPDTASGLMKAGTRRAAQDGPGSIVYGTYGGDAAASDTFGDSGSAARFFYSAKAGPLDRMGSEHPTVKPVDLMRWLCRLVTPAGGTILDLFAGSGTTGIAAMAEGFNAELIDLEPKHVADIERKLALLRGEGRSRFAEQDERKAARPNIPEMPLFAGDPA